MILWQKGTYISPPGALLLFAPSLNFRGRTFNETLALVRQSKRVHDTGTLTGCMMAEGGGPESGSAAESDSEPVAAQMPTPSIENQKQTIGSLLKTTLKKGDEW